MNTPIQLLNKTVSQLLVAAYSYYHLNKSIVSDEVFDGMLRHVIENYNTATHRHKHLIDPTCNNGLSYIDENQYPTIIKQCAQLVN